MAGKIDARLKQLGIELPKPPPARGNYVPWVISGNLVFIAGQVSRIGDDGVYGKLGAGMSIPDGQKAARWCALNILAHLKAACGGDLDRVRRAVKLGGFVNGAPDFPDSPTVINGCSDLLVEIFGEAGKHARFAVSVASLPANVAVEIDAIFELD
jgi:enamine deaminase RidA (YjgF/YER057c/UK114 family)